MIPENNPALKSFIAVDAQHPFPIQNLPFGIFRTANTPLRAGVAIGDWVLDLSVIESTGLLNSPELAGKSLFNQDSLNAFMALGRKAWRSARQIISQLLRDDHPRLRDDIELRKAALIPMSDVEMHLPIRVSGYTDFYSSKEHATNLGVLFRPKESPLLPNWLHLPVAYDGRASSIVVSGTPFRRPMGQLKLNEQDPPVYAATRSLDTEVEVAFIIGTPSQFGEPIPVDDALEHVFGMVLLSDWSARDIQKWEYVPLGPFLGKNFCTSISPWIVSMDALEPFAVDSVVQDPKPLPYLTRKQQDKTYNIDLELTLQTKSMTTPYQVAHTNYRGIYWTISQQLAHHSMGGCLMQTGDVLASGTISGKNPENSGSLIELTLGGKQAIELPNGETRTFIQDGDTVAIRGYCQGDGYCVGFGEVSGTVVG